MAELDFEALARAAKILRTSRALIIGAGAGMGVDSGLPDFRGDQGFWRAYPRYQQLGLSFAQLANPRWFEEDPALAWGFYGHRLNLYRKTQPHQGFHILRDWETNMQHGAFVYTSNVDGQFQRAGFSPERVLEIHGAIEWLQCLAECGSAPFLAGPDEVVVDEDSARAALPHPSCPSCAALARPNILMFGDAAWNDARTSAQERQLDAWWKGLGTNRVAVVECGAGTAIPSVRRFCEKISAQTKIDLIRINPRESEGPPGTISLACGALEGLSSIGRLLR